MGSFFSYCQKTHHALPSIFPQIILFGQCLRGQNLCQKHCPAPSAFSLGTGTKKCPGLESIQVQKLRVEFYHRFWIDQYLQIKVPWKLIQYLFRMRAKILAILLFSLLITSLRGQGDEKEQICKKIRTEGDLINVIASYAGCSNVNTNYTYVIKNWGFYCKKYTTRDDISDLEIITDGEEGTKGSLYLLAFTLYDKKRNLIVVSFRGSICGDNWKNGKTDLQYLPVPHVNSNIGGGCGLRSGCKMHYGFQKTYHWFKKRIRNNVINIYNRTQLNPKPKIVVTGISYGAAIAAIAAYDLKLYGKSKKIQLDIISYTFGQPRIGNQKLIDDMNLHINISRFVNEADPVPHMPTRGGFTSNPINYFNPGHEIFILNKKNGLDLTICSGDGEKCSLNRYGPHFSVDDHTKYYQNYNYSQVIGCREVDLLGKNYISKDKQEQEYQNVKTWGKAKCAQLKCKHKSSAQTEDTPNDTDEKRYSTCPPKDKKHHQSSLNDFICWACQSKKIWIQDKIDIIQDLVAKGHTYDEIAKLLYSEEDEVDRVDKAIRKGILSILNPDFESPDMDDESSSRYDKQEDL